MTREPYAHSKPNSPHEEWQTLLCHEKNTGKLAGDFATAFQSSSWGTVIGEHHDDGKASGYFQKKLDSGKTDGDYAHSAAGACWMRESLPEIYGNILAYCIASHHTGLKNWSGSADSLCSGLAREKKVLEEPEVRNWLLQYDSEKIQKKLYPPWIFKPEELSLWVRMLFSCLVDADYLDTEQFMNSRKSRSRSLYAPLSEIAEPFFERLYRKEKGAPHTEVNRIRSIIRKECEKAAEKTGTLFSLTVPTGGGKTLSGFAFALRHALKWGKKRIVLVIPYTSIVEQTANELRRYLGEENVLEYHSNLDLEKETFQSSLASENFDASVIVTTDVQFFESLYSCSPCRCRKLHNFTESVVILDEVQLLPKHCMKGCLAMLRQLAAHYRTTFLLSTATQPEVQQDLPGILEIVPPELDLYHELKRTEIVFPEDEKRKTWNELAAELETYPQVLCIVNTRKDCSLLCSLMPENTIHLSAAMCGADRSSVIGTIREKLAAGEPVRVISTQVVECGVDLDFPVVYRAFTGLTSIVQSAGRCNREGRSAVPGKVIVFLPPNSSPPGGLRCAEEVMREMLDDGFSAEDPECFRRYDCILQRKVTDCYGKLKEYLERDAVYGQFQFRDAEKVFHMIEEGEAAVLIPQKENEKLISVLYADGPVRSVMRGLQRFAVNVPKSALERMVSAGVVEEVPSGIFILKDCSLYSRKYGLNYNLKEV